jgi:bifunctional DNA-binding transcriptional regulator/antitoxin component of YhaV-PrlF toxin-antitoxin module
MSLKSKVGIAKTGTKSLRTTIPEGIVAYLDLKAGDTLEWRMEVANEGKIVLLRKT